MVSCGNYAQTNDSLSVGSYSSDFAHYASAASQRPQSDDCIGRRFGKNLSTSVSVLNLTNRHLLIDNSLTFDGVHYNAPREIYAELHYKFGY